MGSRLSKLKHASSAVVLLRGKRRFNHRRSMSNDTALTQVSLSSETSAATRPLKIRSKKRRRSDTMPGRLTYPSSHPQHQHHHDASHRLSQMTARTSTTDPDTVLKRFSTPEELSEADRFDHQHYFLQQVTGLTMHVPIERPRRCLDLATGTGIWVLETSGLFPKCEFLGVDVNSRSLPGDLMPSNCRFEQVDITKHLPFANDSFDYIRHHWLPLSTIPIRNSSSCHHNCSGSCHGAMLERKLNRSGTTPATQRQSSSNDWELHLGRCYNVCAPGGWLELMGTDAYIHNGSFVAHRFNNWMNAIEQKRRARLRRNSGVKEKRGSNSSAKYGGSIPGTTATAWPAFYSPTTPSVDSASSTPVMSSSLPTAAPISSIAIASSELPSAAGSNPHITTTNTTTTAESTASSRLILQMLEGGWRDVRHRSWSVPLGGSDSLGMASWRYITSLVASRRSEFIELIREEIQRNEANLASLMATNVQRPMQAQTDPTPLKTSSSFDNMSTKAQAAPISRRLSHIPPINTQNIPVITTTETTSPLPLTPSTSGNPNDQYHYHSNDPSLSQGLPPTPFTTLATAMVKPSSSTSVKAMKHLSISLMERARTRLLGSDTNSALNEVAEDELNRMVHALEQEVIACKSYIVLTIIIGRKRTRDA